MSKPRQEDNVVDTIVIHFVSDVVKNPHAPYSVDRIAGIFEEYRVSAHYLINRDGRVLRLVDEGRVAFHAGKGSLPSRPDRENRLNEHSIGIELMAIGSKNDMKAFINANAYARIDAQHLGFTDKQYSSLNALINDICMRWPGIKQDRQHVIGHDEYAVGRKTDPGELFDWKRLKLKK